MKIPLCIPEIGKEEISAVKDVLESGWLAHGPKNQEFESTFASYIGTKHAVSMNSCTSALQLALITKNITGEVILPSFTFVASANAIINAGAQPVFADVEFDTCNIDPSKIKSLINNKTQAIMPVHFAGQSCKMDEIMELASKNNLEIIEDSAESIGGQFNGKKTGSFGIGCFSFYPTKNITTGEGGMLTTNDDVIAENAEAYRAHGITSTAFEREKKDKPWLRAAQYPGFNFRLCDILASIGIHQMKKLDRMNAQRRNNAELLTSHLQDTKGISLPVESNNCKHVYQMYTVKLDKSFDRVKFISKLRSLGIGASVHFDPPVHKHPFYKKYKSSDLYVTEKLANTIVTLPMYPSLKKEEIEFMGEAVRKSLNELRSNLN
jgi:perosamine synthetase